MAHPHPEGKGAIIAIDRALGRAAIPAESIGYINLHGTASKANDGIEALALAKRFTSDTLASSTKGWTGHTLGAAGIIEAVIALDALETGLIPGTLNCERPDPDLCFTISTKNAEKSIQYSMSNSFGFGGSNASLIFGRCND
jgi:3-oxoacyl-[acyl-carrier-protein] synthase-1